MSLWAVPAGRYSISLKWPSTGVFEAGRPSTSWTAAHILQMSLAISVFTVPTATSSSFHDIVAASSVVWRFQLSAWSPGTLCLTIFMTQCLVMTSSEQHWKHTFLQVLKHAHSTLQASLLGFAFPDPFLSPRNQECANGIPGLPERLGMTWSMTS